jgi:hypothetical protein
MPTPTYIALATVTLGSTTGSVSFSSIPATYRDLILVFSGISTAETGVTMRFNSDSGSNYPYVIMDGYGSGSGSSFGGTDSSVNVAVINTGISLARLQIMDYAQTDKHKTVLASVNAAAAGYVRTAAARWANTNAINTIALAPTGGRSFTSGSTFSLYGVAA